MTTCSTREAAAKLGISLITLERRIKAGIVTAPKISRVGGVRVRLWTRSDITRARRQLAAQKRKP